MILFILMNNKFAVLSSDFVSAVAALAINAGKAGGHRLGEVGSNAQGSTNLHHFVSRQR